MTQEDSIKPILMTTVNNQLVLLFISMVIGIIFYFLIEIHFPQDRFRRTTKNHNFQMS